MKITLKQIGNVFIFKLIGNLVYYEKNKIENKFRQILTSFTPQQFNIIFDLESVDTIDAVGVGKLLKYLKITTSQNGDLILINLKPELYTFLKKMPVNKFF